MNNFTPQAQQALALARREADRLHHNFVGTEHLLLGLVQLGQGVAVNVLRKMGIDLETVRAEVEKEIAPRPGPEPTGNIPYTPKVKMALAIAARESRAFRHSYVGTEHLLLGLIGEGDGVAARVLKHFGVELGPTREAILKALDRNSPTTTTANVEAAKPETKASPGQLQPVLLDTTKLYDVYCREFGEELVVYRNVLFKGAKTLFSKTPHDARAEFLELEQSDGQTVFVARRCVTKFHESRDPGGAAGAAPVT